MVEYRTIECKLYVKTAEKQPQCLLTSISSKILRTYKHKAKDIAKTQIK